VLGSNQELLYGVFQLQLQRAGGRLDIDPGAGEGLGEVALVDARRNKLGKKPEQGFRRILVATPGAGIVDEALEVAEDDRLEERLLGGEVTVDRADTDPGMLGDVVDRDGEAFASEHFLRRLQDPRPVPDGVGSWRARFCDRRLMSCARHRTPPGDSSLTSGTLVPYSLSGTTVPIVPPAAPDIHTERCLVILEDPALPSATHLIDPTASGALENSGADPRRFRALAIIAVAQLMIVLDASVVTIALPSAQHALHISVANRQWVLTAYTLSFGGLLLLGGRIADYVGRKRMFIVSLLGFAGASALGGLAQNAAMLFSARALQGAFAAVMAPAALSLLTVTFTEPHERARAFGVYGAIAGAGAAIGLILGGVLTEYASWRWTLLINVPIAITAAILASFEIRESRAEGHGRYDIPGALTVTSGLLALVYGFTKAASDGWGATTTLSLLVAAAVLLVGFVLVELRSSHPLLPLRVILDRNRGGSFLASFLVGIALFGTFLFLTYYMQGTLHYSALKTGFAFLPFSAGIIIAATAASRLLPRFGPRPVMAAGLFLGSVGLFWFTRIGPTTGYLAHVLPAEIIVSLGMGLSFVPLSSTALIGVAPEDAGVASAMVNTTQQIGGSLGVALLNTVAASATASYFVAHRHAVPNVAAGLVHGYTTAFAVSASLLAAAVISTICLIRARPDRVVALDLAD
jgi:EmrB/QacA subfamily drug resistance transporter